ncbi:CLCA protein, partial [Leiothrix lutea]|nr:CLCA protein [Leiothrix lutea]
MADMELFGAQQPQQTPAGNGTSDGGEEDPAAAFLAQQENEIAGIENDEGFGILENGEVPEALQGPEGLGVGTPCGGGGLGWGMKGRGSPCPSGRCRRDPRPGALPRAGPRCPGVLKSSDANSRKQEAEWKEKAIKELEEWYARQDEKLEKTKASNRAAEEAFVNDAEEVFPGTEWERVAQLCDFNPKSSKQAKDVSRMRSVLISLKQAPLVR